MSFLCLWLSAPNKHSIRSFFSSALLSRSLPKAVLPSSPIVSLLSPREATQRTNCPQMVSRNGRLVSTDCSTALISSCTELQEQRHKRRQGQWTLLWGDSELTVMSLPVWSTLAHLSLVCFSPSQVKRRSTHTALGAAVSNAVWLPCWWIFNNMWVTAYSEIYIDFT